MLGTNWLRVILVPAAACAFLPSRSPLGITEHVRVRSLTQYLPRARRNPVVMMAGGGPPQYDRRPAVVTSNEEVGRASLLIHVKATDTKPVQYQPGHVLALEMKDPEGGEGEDEWMRGPYTVARADDDSFQVLYRVVGKKTESFRAAPIGTEVQFGGKFKVPILEGISNDDGLKRVVGISTGVGVGPLLGFAEQALKEKDTQYRIDIFAAFRHEEDICCSEALNKLASEYPDRFTWTPVVSSTSGRISDVKNLRMIAGEGTPLPDSTHYHMVGNGSMVNEFTAGLAEAGVSDDRVTLEMYFNHKEPARPEAVKAISEIMKEVAVV